MEHRRIGFGGHEVVVACGDGAATAFLQHCFPWAEGGAAGTAAEVLHLLPEKAAPYRLSGPSGPIAAGRLGVRLAAGLYDAVIFHLLRDNATGVALHAGAVLSRGRPILIPGASGAGKSSLTVWLGQQGCTYLTDELVLLPLSPGGAIEVFPRPACLKPPAAGLFAGGRKDCRGAEGIADEDGLILSASPSRTGPTRCAGPPALLLFPRYQPGHAGSLTPLSGARACHALMACVANGRNLVGHGFAQVASLARRTPAMAAVYGSFTEAGYILGPILEP